MEKAKQLTALALNDPNIATEDKQEFSKWLFRQSRFDGSGILDDGRNPNEASSGVDLRRPRLPTGSEIPLYTLGQPLGLSSPPQVTISGVSGHTSALGQVFDSQKSRLVGSHPCLGGGPPPQDSLSPSLHILSSRPWRSNSLTPPGCVSQPDWQPPYPPQSPKGRSHSLSFDHHLFCSGQDPANNNSSAEDEKIEEMIRNLPEGSGMRELKDWLKSLRLHKYTRVLLEFTYEELLDVTEDQLDKKGVTLGARGKIIKNISLIKERPARIQKLSDLLDNEHIDPNILGQILRELESFVLMPTKPYKQPTTTSTTTIQTTSARAITSATRTGRHDSGSDSGTELGHDDDQAEVAKDVPGLIFETLKKVCMVVLLSETSTMEVVTVLACLLERCRNKESFSFEQKKLFNSWLQRLRHIWNPPSIRKATDFKRRSFRTDPTRRTSMHSFLRSGGVAQIPFKSPFSTGSNLVPTSTAGAGPANTGLGLQMNLVPEHPSCSDPPEYSAPFSPRRSMPEIKPVAFSHFKRNSYQEDRRLMMQHRPHFFIDEGEISLNSSIEFSSGINSFGFGSPYSSNASLHNRRESTMSTDSGYLMSLPESRRDSSLSNCDFVGASKSSHHLTDFAEACSKFGERTSQFFSGGSNLFPSFPSSNAGIADRRDSGLSMMTMTAFPEDYLTVPRRGSGCHGGLCHGSVSSGCVSDGSTDSLLEQDLHNLSLAVTQQALE